MELNISSDFTIDDIHKIRAYNYEKTKFMSFNERNDYYEKSAIIIRKEIDEVRKNQT